jgi:hypothetical protein
MSLVSYHPVVASSNEDKLWLKLNIDCMNSNSQTTDVVVYASGEFTVRTPCDDIPEIIRQMTGCRCLATRKQLENELEHHIQISLYSGNGASLRLNGSFYRSVNLAAQPIWKSIVNSYRTLSSSFQKAGLQEKKLAIESINLRGLIAVLSLTEYRDWNRDLRTLACKRLFRFARAVQPDVLKAYIAKIEDEAETYFELLEIAESYASSLAESAFKALYRLAQNCDLTREQLEELLLPTPCAFSGSRRTAGQYVVATKLIPLYADLSGQSSSILCKLSDALLAAPTMEQGLAYQRLLFNAKADPKLRSYISENMVRMRTCTYS